MNDIITEENTAEVCITDALQLLTEDGYHNVCSKYGKVKKVVVYKHNEENEAFVLFENEDSALDMVNNSSDLPVFLRVKMSHLIQNCVSNNNDDILKDDEVESQRSEENPSEKIDKQGSLTGESVYFGSVLSPINLVDDSKNFKLHKNLKQLYHLHNDDLFGRPVDVKWENMKMPDFILHKNNFDIKFKNCVSGRIVVEKKLSRNMFVGYTYSLDDITVFDTLKYFSSSIESSDHLNIEDLQHGMLVGAFDNVTKLFGRGYITMVAGSSANVALSDIGRVINTTNIRVLPESFTEIPALSFKGYTKGTFVEQLSEGKSYQFYINSKRRSIENTRLSLVHDSGIKIKVHIRHWEPTVEESGVPSVNFKSGNMVELLKLNDMNSLVIRSREKCHMEVYFSTSNTVAEYCYSKEGEPLNREPIFGEIIGYKSALSKNYVRGRIYKYLGNNVYSVKQMNDPVKENVNLSAMIALNYEQKCLPQNYFNVGLDNSFPFPIQFEAKQFVDLMKGVILTAFYDESKNQGWKTVNLVIRSLGESLNDILLGLVKPLWQKDTTEDLIEEFGDYCIYDNLLTNDLAINSVQTMTFATFYDGILYMRDNCFGKSYLLMNEMIREYCSMNLLPYLPRNGEVCLGQYKDGNWYRIVCDSVKPGQLVKAYLIDIGVIAFLTTRQCKKMPRELTFEPTHVYPCYLDISGVDLKIDAEKLERLPTFENNDKVEFTVLKKVDVKNSYLIKCPFFERILK